MTDFEISRNLNKLVRGTGLVLKAKMKKDHLRLGLVMVFSSTSIKIKADKTRLYFNGRTYDLSSPLRLSFGRITFQLASVKIPYRDTADSNIHNRLSLVYSSVDGGFVKPILYSLWPGLRGRGKTRALKILPSTETTVYLRQSVRNRLYLTQRRTIKSDAPELRRKITLAYYLSLFLRFKKVILLYEKESLKYEESAAILFEHLIDKGAKNVYFVLDKNSPHAKFVPEKYRSKIVAKHTFKHYLLFFIAKVFIGTEMPAHAIDLRIANKHAVRKINSPHIKYVFLQHGVMYFVALSSDARRAARKGMGGVPKNTKTVVSSRLEAQHFIDHGGYDLEDLYITGLPKFDKNKLAKDADKIVIMPTWRPWEYNQVRTSPEETGYYKMIKNILNSVPKNLQDKVQLLPHPLFIRELETTDLAKYIKDFNSYDEVLQKTKLLITDYSSVSADAFYRGSNVIFWWKDLDYCMEQYGGSLMLSEKNIFGDIATNQRELRRLITENYSKKQDQKYIRRYRKIVEFYDGKNTARVTEALVRDKIIRIQEETL